ncbi:YwmB family TATA-box binding protein [Alicyclobacillus tolerans]|uniref:YwmB family TATA-box binding protein n=1 Tax=Alicyclobacillus tolerans TaxID=90970 RepID=UPI001F2A1E03|nr:YwmB family TATA-box binding protein [Alicyclobacillus tolerans]MCF8567176.1 YwmB family TATA-box binding protein [Alicyclobacillus tolerans]
MKKMLFGTLAVAATAYAVMHHLTPAMAAGRPGVQASVVTPAGISAQTISGQSSQPGSTNQPTQTAAYLERSFIATHAQVSNYEVNNWSQLSQKAESLAQLSQQADRFAQEIHLRSPKKNKYQAAGENYLQLTGLTDGGAQVFAVFSSLQGQANTSESILTVRVDGTAKDLSRFPAVLNTLNRGLVSIGAIPQISACLEGTLDAKLSRDYADKVVQQAFAAVHASRVEGIQTGQVTSISGYSPLERTFILTNGQKMNLQVAVHYDAYHHRTNVLVGTPIITRTY